MSWTLQGNHEIGFDILDGTRLVCRVDDQDDAERIISSMQETIDCAAVAYDGKVWAAPRPGRHNAAIILIVTDRGRNVSGAQGFTTSTGRFVGRVEAAKIALDSGQIKVLSRPEQGILYSEDLW